MSLSSELELGHAKSISALVKECDKYDMPIMIEPRVMGNRIPKEQERDSEMIADGCRIALELGADIKKLRTQGARIHLLC